MPNPMRAGLGMYRLDASLAYDSQAPVGCAISHRQDQANVAAPALPPSYRQLHALSHTWKQPGASCQAAKCRSSVALTLVLASTGEQPAAQHSAPQHTSEARWLPDASLVQTCPASHGPPDIYAVQVQGPGSSEPPADQLQGQINNELIERMKQSISQVRCSQGDVHTLLPKRSGLVTLCHAGSRRGGSQGRGCQRR